VIWIGAALALWGAVLWQVSGAHEAGDAAARGGAAEDPDSERLGERAGEPADDGDKAQPEALDEEDSPGAGSPFDELKKVGVHTEYPERAGEGTEGMEGAQGNGPAPEVAPLTPNEEAVVGAYDHLADALESSTRSCEETGQAARSAVRKALPAIRTLSAEDPSGAPAVRKQVADHLAQAAPDRLARFKSALSSAMARCPNDPQLQQALQELASAANPSR
jgi:hypothetical protein